MDHSQLSNKPLREPISQEHGGRQSRKRRLFCWRHIAVGAALILVFSTVKLAIYLDVPFVSMVIGAVAKSAGLIVAVCYVGLGIEHLLAASIDARDVERLHRVGGIAMIILGLTMFLK